MIIIFPLYVYSVCRIIKYENVFVMVLIQTFSVKILGSINGKILNKTILKEPQSISILGIDLMNFQHLLNYKHQIKSF